MKSVTMVKFDLDPLILNISYKLGLKNIENFSGEELLQFMKNCKTPERIENMKSVIDENKVNGESVRTLIRFNHQTYTVKNPDSVVGAFVVTDRKTNQVVWNGQLSGDSNPNNVAITLVTLYQSHINNTTPGGDASNALAVASKENKKGLDVASVVAVDGYFDQITGQNHLALESSGQLMSEIKEEWQKKSLRLMEGDNSAQPKDAHYRGILRSFERKTKEEFSNLSSSEKELYLKNQFVREQYTKTLARSAERMGNSYDKRHDVMPVIMKTLFNNATNAKYAEKFKEIGIDPKNIQESYLEMYGDDGTGGLYAQRNNTSNGRRKAGNQLVEDSKKRGKKEGKERILTNDWFSNEGRENPMVKSSLFELAVEMDMEAKISSTKTRPPDDQLGFIGEEIHHARRKEFILEDQYQDGQLVKIKEWQTQTKLVDGQVVTYDVEVDVLKINSQTNRIAMAGDAHDYYHGQAEGGANRAGDFLKADSDSPIHMAEVDESKLQDPNSSASSVSPEEVSNGFDTGSIRTSTSFKADDPRKEFRSQTVFIPRYVSAGHIRYNEDQKPIDKEGNVKDVSEETIQEHNLHLDKVGFDAYDEVLETGKFPEKDNYFAS